MLRASIGFFIFGLLALFLGANNIAGISMELGKILLGIFVILAVISFIYSLATGDKTKMIS